MKGLFITGTALHGEDHDRAGGRQVIRSTIAMWHRD
jgi:hypothetical protein